MSVLASIKFVQGATVGAVGQALKGVVTTPVVASNGDDTGVEFWQWSVIAAPPTSAVPLGLLANTPTATFTPDLAGGYLLQLVTIGYDGSTAQDFRCFGVNQPSGRFIPPFDGDSGSLNFAGEPNGWDPIMRVWLLLGDLLHTGAGSPNGVVTASPGALYLNTTGGAGTTLYVKESGTNTNTGWVGK